MTYQLLALASGAGPNIQTETASRFGLIQALGASFTQGLFLLPALLNIAPTAHHGRRSFRFQRWRFNGTRSFFAGAGPTTSHAQHGIWHPDFRQGFAGELRFYAQALSFAPNYSLKPTAQSLRAWSAA